MEKVEFSKCVKCEKIKHIAELERDPNLIGFVCINKEICAKDSIKIKSNSENEK